MPVTTIDLLRHGEVDGERCLGGGSDPPLCPCGWSQLRALLACRPRWESIVSSPLLRCAAFAREVAERYGLELQLEGRFREIDMGGWEGRPWPELWEREPGRLLDLWRDPIQNPAPGGESYLDFERRVFEAWEELLEAGSGRHWLVVTHGGTIRAILRRILDFPVTRLFRIEVPHACLSRLRCDPGAPARLVFHGGSLC